MEAADLAVLSAVTSDEATKRKLAELAEALQRIEDAKKELADRETAVAQQLAEARQARLDGVKAVADAEARKRGLDEREAELSRSNQAILAEKAEFGKVRGNVEAEQRERRDALAARETELQGREHAVALREETTAARERKAIASQQALDRKHQRLAQALADENVPLPGQARADAG